MPRLLLLVFGLMLFVSLPESDAQQGKRSKEDLIKSKAAIEKEIEFNRRLLAETQKNKKASLSEVAIIRDQIAKRERLIATIDREVNLLDNQIDQNRKNINMLRDNLERMKKEYAKLIYQAYRSKSTYQRLMFIFAADDFNQAYQRLRYMQYYSKFRKRQVDVIKNTQERINNEIAQLETDRVEKQGLLSVQEGEKVKLSKEKQKKDEVVRTLTKKEKEIREDIRKKQIAANNLQKTIDDIIAKEIASASRNSAASKPNASSSFALTPEEKQLSVSFEGNKGKLPWPTERGVVSGAFGTQPHPDIQNVFVQNNGINIVTAAGSTARAVFSGTVTAIRSVPTFRNVVIIRHGEYLTVYTNLDNVTVKEGDKVSVKQVLGTIHTDTENARTELHFEVRKGFTLLNPTDWLAKKN